jgi:peptidoglycan hydrolase CwlO-like protein
MNETLRKMIEAKLEVLGTSLSYHQQEAKDYRSMVRDENKRIKELKEQIDALQEALEDEPTD